MGGCGKPGFLGVRLDLESFKIQATCSNGNESCILCLSNSYILYITQKLAATE